MSTTQTSKRICITTLEYPPDIGGVGTSVYRIAHMLKALGYEVHVAVFHSKHRKENDGTIRTGYRTVEDEGILVHRIRSAVRSETLAVQDYLSEVYAQVRSLHLTYQFDAFHAFFLNETGFLTTLLAREYGVPVINSIRGNDLHKHIFNPKQHGQIAWTLEHSDWVTCVNRDLRRRANVLVPGLERRSNSFWNSIVPIDFADAPVPPMIQTLRQREDTGLLVGSVGRFRDKKGIDFLIDACELVQQDLPVTLLLVGDFVDKEKDYWDDLIQASGFSDRIHVTGMMPREEALTYLPHLDVFAIPSVHDGCPNAMLEAMLAGCAVIGTDVDAMGEILTDRHDALVVPPSSSKAIAKALRTLAAAPDLRRQLGLAARETVLTQLAPAVEQENWAKVYQRVLQDEPVPMMAIA
ncbi:glycosyltransferase [Vacuolonema iberomarrocanum]|uniref:glycosyltransferase n=1 Tax=Vacuolonema iberomarrocanum TaxID=3454632 RepID=UPI0019E6B087|nr:glycosyltransferase [filamentous cyanobacterium LEGE 07170]